MFIFVSGATRSGKSEWAEAAVAALSGGEPMVYLATARAADEDMRRRIERHQARRRGRGFLTIERPCGLSGVLASVPAGASVLLECLPTWVANEMFREDGTVAAPPDVREEVLCAARGLRARCRHLTIVSDDIFSDGARYDGATELYLRLLGELHVRLAGEADEAVECAAGRPRFAKGAAPQRPVRQSRQVRTPNPLAPFA